MEIGSWEWEFASEGMMYAVLKKWLGNSLESGTSAPCLKMSVPNTVITVLVHPNIMVSFPKGSWCSRCFPSEREVLREGEIPFHAHMKCQCWVTKVCVAMCSASYPCGKFADTPDLNLGDTRVVRCGSRAASALGGLCSPGPAVWEPQGHTGIQPFIINVAWTWSKAEIK